MMRIHLQASARTAAWCSLPWARCDSCESGVSGFTFRYDRDLQGRERRYWHLGRSAKALKKERSKLPEMTDRRQCFQPIPQRIEKLNRHLKGWRNDFQFGYPRRAFREVNRYVRERLVQHLRRRSQRFLRPPEGVSYY